MFKDREELATSHSLSETIQGALENSEYLVVLASKHASESRWVNEEIRFFLENRDPSHLILVIPPDHMSAGLPQFDAVRQSGLEPIAADARADADGQVRALRKVLARLLNVDFDDLQQRDQRRRRLRFAAITVAMLASVIIASTLILESQRAEREAETQRGQASELADFLVDDLSKRLTEYEEVGTLDAGLARALDFFEGIDVADMDKPTLENYRAALTGVGSVRIRQGKPSEALDSFIRAEQVSLQIASLEPDNAERWHEQAQSAYYIGEAYWEMQDVASAAEYIEQSMEFANRAFELAPEEYAYQLEVIFALNNLGAIHTRLRNWSNAEDFSARALTLTEQRLDSELPDEEQRLELINQQVEAVSWLVEITQTLGRFDEAFEWHRQEIELRRWIIDATDNPQQHARLIDALGFYGKSLGAVGRIEEQTRTIEEAIEIGRDLSGDDPDNVFWRLRLHNHQALLGMNRIASGALDEAESALDSAEAGLERIVAEQDTPLARIHLAFTHGSRAYVLMTSGQDGVRESLESAFALLAEPVQANTVHPVVSNHFARSVVIDAAWRLRIGEEHDRERLARALSLLDTGEQLADVSVFDASWRALLLLAADRRLDAQPVIARLGEVGYQAPLYQCLLALLGSDSRLSVSACAPQ